MITVAKGWGHNIINGDAATKRLLALNTAIFFHTYLRQGDGRDRIGTLAWIDGWTLERKLESPKSNLAVGSSTCPRVADESTSRNLLHACAGPPSERTNRNGKLRPPCPRRVRLLVGFLTRGTYDGAPIYDSAHPVPEGRSLDATRRICASPFPEDQGRVLYFAGYDGPYADNRSAWIYRPTMSERTGGGSR